MADNKESIILDVQFNAEKVAEQLGVATRQIQLLKQEQKNLNKALEEGRISEQDYGKAIAENSTELEKANRQTKGYNAILKQLNDTTGQYGDTLSEQQRKLNDMQKAYDALSKSQRESAEGKAFLQSIKEQSDAVKGLEEETGRAQRNVGNYPKTLTSVIPGFDKLNAVIQKTGLSLQDFGSTAASAMKTAGNSMKTLGKQALTLLANPIVAAVAVVAVVLKQLYDAFQRNERAQLSWQKAIAPFKALWQNFQRIFDDIIKAFQRMRDAMGANGEIWATFMNVALKPIQLLITKIRVQILTFTTVFEAATKAIGAGLKSVQSWIKATPLGDFMNKVGEAASKARKAFSDFGDKVRAKIDEISKSDFGQAVGLDKYRQGLRDIINAQSELEDANRRIAQSEHDIAVMRRENIEADAKATRSVAELREKANEKDRYSVSERIKFIEEANRQEIAIANRAYELAKKQYEAEKLKNSLTESNAEDREREAQAYANMLQTQTALFSKQRELQSQLSELRKQEIAERRKQEDQQIALIQDETERALAVRRAAGNREVEDLRRKLDKLKETDVEGRKAISELMLKIEESTQKELTRIQLDAEQKRRQQQQQNALARVEIDTRGDALLVGEKRLQIAEENYNKLQNLTKEQVAALYKTEEDYAAALLAAEQEQFDAREAVATEEYSRKMQRIQNEYDARLIGIDNEAALAEIELEQHQEEYDRLVEMDAETKARLFANEEEYDAAVIAAQKKLTASMDSMVKSKMNSVKALGSAFTQMSDALGEYSEQSEAAAKAQKAFALAGILMNQAVSISEGVLAVSKGIESAASIPFPANIPAIISVVAQITAMLASAITGIQQAKQVFQQGSAAADAGNFAHGGVVKGTSYTGDKVIAHVNSGEGITTGAQANNLLQEIANNPARGGFDFDALAGVLTEVLQSLPAPVLVYEEFRDFEKKTATIEEIASV